MPNECPDTDPRTFPPDENPHTNIEFETPWRHGPGDQRYEVPPHYRDFLDRYNGAWSTPKHLFDDNIFDRPVTGHAVAVLVKAPNPNTGEPGRYYVTEDWIDQVIGNEPVRLARIENLTQYKQTRGFVPSPDGQGEGGYVIIRNVQQDEFGGPKSISFLSDTNLVATQVGPVVWKDRRIHFRETGRYIGDDNQNDAAIIDLDNVYFAGDRVIWRGDRTFLRVKCNPPPDADGNRPGLDPIRYVEMIPEDQLPPD